MAHESQSTVKTKTSWSGLVVVLLFLVIVGVLTSIYFYLQFQKVKTQTGNTASSAEVKEIVADVGKLIVLPTETPTLATVSDITKLKGQSFFKQAEDGDKVLIYPNSKEAILYRPSLNKIIAVSTVNISGAPTPEAQGAISPTPSLVNVELLNGTKTVGLTSIGEKMLAATNKEVKVTDRENAARDDYAKTLVIDMTKDKHTEDATRIATALNGIVGKLPDGETATKSADILVILGQDFAEK